MSEQELWDALDGMLAYDVGATDSGIHDEVLRERVHTQLHAMDRTALSHFLAFARPHFDGDPEEYDEFLLWLRDEMSVVL